MNIFSTLRQKQLLSRFHTELDASNRKILKKVDINKTSRKRNLEDFIKVMPELNEIISSISVFENGLTPSFALDFSDEQLKRYTNNKSAVEFSVMLYIQEDKQIPEKEVKELYKSLSAICPNVDISGRMHKCYITLVFDAHKYSEDNKKMHEAVAEYFNTVLEPTIDSNPLGQADVNQIWNAAIEWYKTQEGLQ